MSIISFALIIVVSFIAGIEGILDEFQFHQPLVACTLIGLVTNHLQEGLILGGSLQMMALGWANVGASVAPDVTLASVASSIFMVQGLNGSVTGEYVISFYCDCNSSVRNRFIFNKDMSNKSYRTCP